jgi:hypothetical protein
VSRAAARAVVVMVAAATAEAREVVARVEVERAEGALAAGLAVGERVAAGSEAAATAVAKEEGARVEGG